MPKVVPIRPGPVPVDVNTYRAIRVIVALAAKDGLEACGVLTQVQGKLITGQEALFSQAIAEACLAVVVRFTHPIDYHGE